MDPLEKARGFLGEFLTQHPDPGRAQIALILGLLAILILAVRGPRWGRTLLRTTTSLKSVENDNVPMLLALLKFSACVFVLLYSVRTMFIY